MANLRDRMYWRGSPQEPIQDLEGARRARLAHLDDYDLAIVMAFDEKMSRLRHMRAKLRGSNVSMPRITRFQAIRFPEEVLSVLDAYIKIEIWNLKMRALLRRQTREEAQAWARETMRLY